MPTSAGTSPTDVKVEIDTDLGDPDINEVLERVERDVDRAYSNSDFDNDQHRQDFEAVLGALRIATGNAPDAQDRSASEVDSGRSSVVYEASVVSRLEAQVQRRDPGSAFGAGTVLRDTDRQVSSSELS